MFRERLEHVAGGGVRSCAVTHSIRIGIAERRLQDSPRSGRSLPARRAIPVRTELGGVDVVRPRRTCNRLPSSAFQVLAVPSSLPVTTSCRPG